MCAGADGVAAGPGRPPPRARLTAAKTWPRAGLDRVTGDNHSPYTFR